MSPAAISPARRRWWFRAVAVAGALAVALLLGELLVRLLVPVDVIGSSRVQSPQRGQLINRADGHARHQRGDRAVEYRFDGRHLRGPPPTAAPTKVLLLGDSFTFGVLLDEPDTYAHRLRMRAEQEFGADRVELLNGGVSGFGLANVVAFVEEFGDELRPDLLVVFVNGGDIQRSVDSGLYSWDEHGGLRANVLPALRLKSLVNALPGYGWVLEHSHLLQLARRALIPPPSRPPDTGPPPAPVPDSAVRLGEALFERLWAYCRARGIGLLVLTTGYQDSPHFGAQRYPSLRFLAGAPALFERLGVPFHDLGPDVAARSGGDWARISIPGDGHPNEAGARLVAELAWPWIEPEIRAAVAAEAQAR